MVEFLLSDSELEIVRNLIIKQIGFAIDKLNYLRTEIKEDHQLVEKELILLILLLLLINKSF